MWQVKAGQMLRCTQTGVVAEQHYCETAQTEKYFRDVTNIKEVLNLRHLFDNRRGNRQLRPSRRSRHAPRQTAGGEHVMVIKKKRMALLVSQAFAAASLISVSANSFGQAVERVEVTGSNIPRVTSETASPVTVISREEIEKSGRATVAEYLQILARDSSGSVPMSFVNGFAAGASGISLRGLGASSTLVLMNGRRIAPYGQADDGQKVFTDLSVIPIEAVERIEVLRDGASAIYGSDAIPGVGNIILRQGFPGTVAKASHGRARRKHAGP